MSDIKAIMSQIKDSCV